MRKIRDKKGIIFIIVGIIFWMVNFTVLYFDILPDTIGACFVYWGLKRLTYNSNEFVKPMKYVGIYGVISILDFYSFIIFRQQSLIYYIYCVAMILTGLYLQFMIFKSMSDAFLDFASQRNKVMLVNRISYCKRDILIALCVNGVFSLIGLVNSIVCVAAALLVQILFLVFELSYLIMVYEIRREFKSMDL